MKSPLVSIITPCYNGEKFIDRFLNSLLDQRYENIEFIFVNDGSLDNTEKIFFSYQDKLLKKNIKYQYYYQNNQGQASALHHGLKNANGIYITWSDADDMLHSHSIKEKVEFLEKNPQYAFVRTDGYIVDESNIHKILGVVSKSNHNNYKEYLFEDFLWEKNIGFMSGRYMFRKNEFVKANSGMDIYTGKGGQNWQILLPLSYRYKCGYIDIPLHIYVTRKQSHSHLLNSSSGFLRRYEEHRKILIETINRMRMPIEEKKKCFAIIEERYARKKLYIAGRFYMKKLAIQEYNFLLKNEKVGLRDYVEYLSGSNKFLNEIMKVIRNIRALYCVCLRGDRFL